jgi:hypothetical protein
LISGPRPNTRRFDVTKVEQRFPYDPPNKRWRTDLTEALRLDQGYRLTSTDLDTEVHDYLSHHGDLALALDAIKDEDHHDHEPADYAKAILHTHLLVISLLLQRIDAHEWQRTERQIATDSESFNANSVARYR